MAEPLPQLTGDRLFIGDGGLETSLIFHQSLELPDFAAFTLLADDAGREAVRAYFQPYLGIARDQDVGLVLDTVTWRANPDWAARLDYSTDALDEANRDAVALAEEMAGPLRTQGTPVVVNGVLGPRGDGYVAGDAMSPEEAERYHARQVETFESAGAEMVTAVTMTYAAEAVGIVRAARAAGIPPAISFTVETDGRLPDGQPLGDAIEQVDAETRGGAAYFMINCAHPTHFEDALPADARWLERIVGIRANASTLSHAELDEAEELDDGDPSDLAARYAELRRRLPAMNLVGGCCGTDHRHVAAACAACLAWGQTP
jgi:S-methylmethionine-dependent homocysteine/selenocysteine methylase